MANTYTSLFYHFTFSTKDREPWITVDIENRVWPYLGGIARKHKMIALQVGGIEDHIHTLVLAPPTLAPSQIAQFLKGDSSKWIHEEFSRLRGFEWQDGYGAFSVSRSAVPDVIEYIQNQREHHRRKTFQQEYLELLQKHGVDYDERYLWG
jgi:REP element-mobilizing transposase RayT